MGCQLVHAHGLVGQRSLLVVKTLPVLFHQVADLQLVLHRILWLQVDRVFLMHIFLNKQVPNT